MTYKYQKYAKVETTKINDEFWSEIINNVRNIMLPNVFEKFKSTGEFYHNFVRRVSGNSEHRGNPFNDGLTYEALRGASDFLADEYDERLDRIIDDYIEKIDAAQSLDKNGYINTYTDAVRPQNRWGEHGGNLIYQHDVFNSGALVEAGVHHYKATGKTTLLKCSVKIANYMSDYMGESPKKNIVPAHSLPEEALLKLYQLFSEEEKLKKRLSDEYGIAVEEKKYLELARFWLENRGNHKNRASYPQSLTEYSQDQRPLLETGEAVGHAVRAALLYTGATAYAMASNDVRFSDTVKRLWRYVLSRQLYINGGVGASHFEEKFTYDFNLPHKGYMETCAGVAMAFWSGEMHGLTGKGECFDEFERVLYNNILSAMSNDYKKYFYINPLVGDPGIVRWEWNKCPCCPPMILKMMSSLKNYIFSKSEDTLFVNLHIGSSAELKMKDEQVRIDCKIQSTQICENRVHIRCAKSRRFNLALRVPYWSGKFEIKVNSAPVECSVINGYAQLDRMWNDDIVELSIYKKIILWQANPWVESCKGQTAIQYGPMLYCIEDEDNESLDVMIKESDLFSVKEDIIGNRRAFVIECEENGKKKFTAIPYYLWGNRSNGNMKVWIDSDSEAAQPFGEWDFLYKKMKEI